VVVLGGAHVSSKMPVLESLLARADAVYLGGAMASTFLRARGGALGRSLLEEDRLPLARALLARAQDRGVQVILPRDSGGRGRDPRLVRAGGTVPSRARRPGRARHRSGHRARLREASCRRAPCSGTAPWAWWNPNPSPPARWPWRVRWAATRGAFTVASGTDSVNAIHRAGVAGTDLSPHHRRWRRPSISFEGRKLPGLVALES
jgi:phosphoglycerate kinase